MKPGVECPSRSLTTLIGTPALSSRVAWVWRQVVEPDAGKTGSVHELLERVREQLWVSRLSVGSGEDVTVGIVAVELGVLVGALLSPGVEDVERARVEVDRLGGRCGTCREFHGARSRPTRVSG